MSEWRAAVDRRLDALGVTAQRRIEIVEEIADGLQDRYEELRAAGYTEAGARRLVLADFHADALVRELTRIEDRAAADPVPIGLRRSTIMGTLWPDIRYAARSLCKSPGFTAVVVATLALGIGANTAIFSVVDAVMLRSYGYPDIDRIVVLNERTRSGQPMSISWPNYQDWAAQNQVFEYLGLYRSATVNLTGAGEAERLSGSVVSSGVFGAMGLQPAIGRTFTADEDRAGGPRTAVISERLWRNRFDADPSIVGRSLVLNGDPYVVAGVMPSAMRFPSRLTDVWLSLGPIVDTFPGRGAHPGLFGVGKLKAGVTFDRAVADMDTIARRLEQQYPASNRDNGVAMTRYYEQVVQHIRPTLQVLLGAVGFVLLIGCANLANLMLARSERRHREIAVRRALGADRRRIVQQLLTESLLMAVLGGGLGVLLATWMVKAFVASRPATVPRIDLVGVDLRVLAFAAVLSVTTGIVFGLLPALRASNPDLLSALKQIGRGASGAPSRRLQSALVVGEVALALMLLVGAGLMLRSFARLMSIDPGFNAENVIAMRTTLPAARYPDRARWTAFHQELVRRVSALPGVALAGLNSAVPLEGGASESAVVAEGQPLPAPGVPGTVTLFQTSTPGYLQAMGIPLLRGRPFTDQDTRASTPVVIVDETLVQRLFPGQDPVGKRIAFEFQGGHESPVPVWREIVGVTRHVRHYGIASGPPYVQLHTPLEQLPTYYEQRRPSMALVVRTTLPPEMLTMSVRRELAAIDPDIPVYGVQTMTQYLAQNVEQPRLSVLLLGGLGMLALLLAVVGIYGVISYSVAQRTQEIGVRMALGATRGDVMRLVVGRAMILVMTGIVLGIGAGLATASVVRTMVFQVSERDPWTFAAIAALLATVGLVASLVPARRASAVDPIVALRES